MAVEARHLCLFPQQILGNRDMVTGIEGGNPMGSNHMYGGTMGYGLVSGTTTTTDDTLIPPPIHGTTLPADSIPVKTPMKSDSGLTYSIPVVVSRKRPRACAASGITNPDQWLSFQANNNRSGSVTFLGEDISYQIHQHQWQVDQLIAQHAAKMRREIEEQRKSNWRRIITAVEESITKKLRAKEEEIDNIGRLNWALEEKLKSLCVENQIWRELAQSNEATANALRNNLEQVLAQTQAQAQEQAEALILMDDARSCCGSNSVEEEERRTLAEHDDIDGRACAVGTMNKNNATSGSSRSRRRLCRTCGKDEASVLLLPCRHLCVCDACGPALHSCPICLSTNNATLHINFSSSSSQVFLS